MTTLTYDPTPADQPEFSEEEQEALAVGEQLEQEQNQLLAGKFEDASQLEKAYIELQQKLGQKEDTEPESEEKQEQEDEDSGSILDELWEKAVAKEVTEELVEKLNQQSPEDLAKMYLDYRQSVEQNRQPRMSNEDVSQLKGLVGGDEGYKQMIEWAGSNLNEQEINLYDQVMDSGNPAAAYFAVQALAARFQDAQGVDGNLITGKAPAASQKGFRSQAELVAAMSDPRYDNDPAYREDVMKKLENSQELAF